MDDSRLTKAPLAYALKELGAPKHLNDLGLEATDPKPLWSAVPKARAQAGLSRLPGKQDHSEVEDFYFKEQASHQGAP